MKKLKKFLSTMLVASMSLSMFVGFGSKEVEAAINEQAYDVTLPAGFSPNYQLPSHEKVTLDQNAVPNATEYVVKRDGSVVGNPAANSFSESGPTADTNYNYTYTDSAKIGKTEGSVTSVMVRSGTQVQIPQVENIKVEELRLGYIKASFDPVPGATYYTLKRNGSDIGNGYENFFEHYGSMVAGTQYTYEISANVNGVQGPAGIVTITAPEKVPTPTNVEAVSNSPTSVQLSWDPIPNATDYIITLNLTTIREVVAEITTTSYEHTGLRPDTNYTYFVQARIGDIYSDPEVASVRTQTQVQIPQIENIEVEELRLGYIKVSFDPVPGATNYALKRNGSNIGSVYENFFVHNGSMVTGTQYTYEISANVNGVQGPAGTVTITAPEKVPTPTNVKAVSNSPTSVQLSWDPVPNATDYIITLNPTTIRGVVAEITTTSYKHTGLHPDTNYTYFVQARIGDIYSDPEIVLVRTLAFVPLTAPEDFKVTAKTDKSVSFSWSPVPGATGYQLKNSVTGAVVYDCDAVTVATVSGLNPNTYYTFEVAAKDGSVQIGPSSSVNVTTNSEVIPYPTGFTVTKVTYDQVDLIWDINPNIDSYTLYRDGVELENTSFNFYTDSSVTENTKHIYSLVAKKGGQSSQPAILQVTIPAKSIDGGAKVPDNGNGGGTTPPANPGDGSNSGSVRPTSPSVGSGDSTTPPTSEGSGKDGKGTSEDGKSSDSEVGSEKNPSEIVEFSDVKENHFASDAIKELTSKGVIAGYKNGTFGPNKTVTRAEFAIMLKRALGLSGSFDYSTKFTDIEMNAWYAEELSVALHHGVTKGFTDKTFRPNDLIPREQAAVMISNILRNAGITNNGTAPVFTDSKDIVAWATEDVMLAVEQGIIKGYSNNTFLPKANITRGETAVLIQRLLKVIDNQ